jgi:hypothetical protein
LAAAGLAVVLVAGSLLRPSASALAWDPSPTAVSDAQRAAATNACADGLPAAVMEHGTPVGPANQQGGGAGVQTAQGSAVTVVTGSGPVVPAPPIPTTLPPMIGLELHGTGAVAIFADDKATAYCLLVKNGDDLAMAALLFPDLGNGASAGVGAIGAGSAEGSGSLSVSSGPDGFTLTALTTMYRSYSVGIIAGLAPTGTVKVKVVGGPADGATATVVDRRFAMWAPDDFLNATAKVEALDASGKVLGTQDLGVPADAPAVMATSAP